MKYRKYERERAEMLKIDEKTALLDEKILDQELIEFFSCI